MRACQMHFAQLISGLRFSREPCYPNRRQSYDESYPWNRCATSYEI